MLRRRRASLVTAAALVAVAASGGCMLVASLDDHAPPDRDDASSSVPDGASAESGSGDGGAPLDGDGGSPIEPPDAGMDATPCTPSMLRPEEAGSGVFCPFTAAGSVHCAPGQQCCEPPAPATSTCTASSTSCSGIVWQCTDRLQCPGNTPTCCATMEVAPTTTGSCSSIDASAFVGTRCATSCAANEYVVCERGDDCPAGATCQPLRVRAIELGFCK